MCYKYLNWNTLFRKKYFRFVFSPILPDKNGRNTQDHPPCVSLCRYIPGYCSFLCFLKAVRQSNFPWDTSYFVDTVNSLHAYKDSSFMPTKHLCPQSTVFICLLINNSPSYILGTSGLMDIFCIVCLHGGYKYRGFEDWRVTHSFRF